MTNAERELVSKNLAESRERLLLMAQGLTPEQLRYRPGPDRWTIAEILEHITVVEGRAIRIVGKALEAPPDFSKRSAMDGRGQELFEKVAGRAARLKAPEPALPMGRWKDEELLPEFEVARRRTRDFVATTDADLRHHFFPHPVFGEVDCYQWLLIVAAHCDRHRLQGEEVMAADGFPRAGKASA